MAVRYHYLALDRDQQLVVDWFSSLPHEVSVDDRSDRRLLYFRGMAKVPLPLDGPVKQESTPFIFIEKPQIKLGTIYTDAEVIFSPTPLRPQFPELYKISVGFGKWLRGFELVFSQKDPSNSELKYYLEGGIQNFDEELFALPEAAAALRQGQYFVHYRDSDARLRTLSKTLALRGYRTER